MISVLTMGLQIDVASIKDTQYLSNEFNANFSLIMAVRNVGDLLELLSDANKGQG